MVNFSCSFTLISGSAICTQHLSLWSALSPKRELFTLIWSDLNLYLLSFRWKLLYGFNGYSRGIIRWLTDQVMINYHLLPEFMLCFLHYCNLFPLMTFLLGMSQRNEKDCDKEYWITDTFDYFLLVYIYFINYTQFSLVGYKFLFFAFAWCPPSIYKD